MKKQNNVAKEIRSWLFSVLVPVTVVLLINLFVCKLAIVSGSSMYPTLYNKDLLVVWMLQADPDVGDIVVVNTSPSGVMGGERLVKRVIATAGQTIWIDYDANLVYVDGKAMQEDYLNFEEADPMKEIYWQTEWTVPEGSIFVLGDNRNHSSDSRDPGIGLISVGDVLGVEILRIPLGEWLSEG